MKKPILLSWSSGKDSAWALYQLQQSTDYVVVGLVTTINQEFERVAMHAVRLQLLHMQAEAAGLPLHTIRLPWPCSNEAYEVRMSAFIGKVKSMGIEHMAFGDLFLEDVRAYREKQLADTGITPVFPIWGIPTDTLAQKMVAAGLKAVLTCVDPTQLAPGFAGRVYDARLLAELPATVDACGERGEFHSFAFAGPMFNHSIDIQVGETVERDGFVFADLLPQRRSAAGSSITPVSA